MSTEHRADRGVAPVYPSGPADPTPPQGLPPVAGPPSDMGEPTSRRRIWLLIIAAGAAVALLVPLLTYVFGRESDRAPIATAPSPPPSAATSPAQTAATPAPNQAAPDGRIPSACCGARPWTSRHGRPTPGSSVPPGG